MSGKNREGRDPDSDNTARGDDAPPEDEQTVETKSAGQSDPELIRGKVLGDKYEILALLGKGAMGAVYKARHQILNKEVAIKVLNKGDVDDKVKKERFMREAKGQSALNHRNIAAVHDFGLTEKDQPFFVMDFLKGETLEELLEREKSLPCADSCQIFEQIARGLQHAHSKGIVHRDIKPSNIMLIDSDEGGFHALLVDFGIAVHSEKELTKLTKVDHIVGTPHYMSPEQIKGKTLDARSDIYSLGCVMFEALTGNMPFCGISGQATMAMHLAQPPEHITSFKTKTPLPEELAELVMRCIEKQPENRYGSAKEVAALLNDIRPLAERALKEQLEAAQKTENQSDLSGAGKGHQQNPAHAPYAVVESGEELKAENKVAPKLAEKSERVAEKVAEEVNEKVELKEKANDSSESQDSTEPIDDDKSDSSSSMTRLDESERLDSKVSRDTEGDSRSIDDQSQPGTNSPTSSDATRPIPVINQPATTKEPLDFSFSGHDKIRVIVAIITMIVFEPLYGRLALPINPSEMRDDFPFFMLAKYLVELNNHLAHHIAFQWVVPILITVFVIKILNKLLADADD